MKINIQNPLLHTVRLDTIKVGECFMYDNRVGMVVSRNGHTFPLELETGKEFYLIPPGRPWLPHVTPATISFDTEVTRVKTELTCQIVP